MSDNSNPCEQPVSFLPRLSSQLILLAHLRSLPPSTFTLQPLHEQEERFVYQGEFEVELDDEVDDEAKSSERRFKEEAIQRLEEEQDSRPCPPMSRACAKCSTVPAEHRKVFACGHAICQSCAEGCESCPVCEKEGIPVKLFEELDNDGPQTDQRSHVFTRKCWNCYKEPLRRAVYTKCGHIVCRVCAERWELATLAPSCPHCKSEGGFVALVEERL